MPDLPPENFLQKIQLTAPQQHMHNHSIHSPSYLETVVQLVKQCEKEGWDFPEESLPIPRASDSKGRPQTLKITDYQVRGGFRLHARGTMAYNQVRRAVSLWIAMDCLPYSPLLTRLAFRAMLCALDEQAPDLGPKECDKSGMHTHFASCCVSVLLFFHLILFVANAAKCCYTDHTAI